MKTMIDLGFLSFLAEWWFVVPWYAIGILGVFWVWYDLSKVNTPVNTAVKLAWPVIILFFSVLGVLDHEPPARHRQVGRR